MPTYHKVAYLVLWSLIGTSGVFGQNAVIKNPVSWTNLCEDVDILCSSGGETPLGISLCRWTRNSLEELDTRTVLVNITSFNGEDIISVEKGPSKFSRAGDGLSKGQCSMRISEITSDEIGQWSCTLVGLQNELWIGKLQVLFYEKPTKPEIAKDTLANLVDHGDWETPSATTVSCCTSGGKPVDQTKLALFYDGKLSSENRTKLEDPNKTCVTWTKVFMAEDSGKTLSCFVDHPAFAKSTPDEKTDEIRIVVNYPPTFMAFSDNWLVDKPEYFHTFMVKGNPVPKIRLQTNDTLDFTNQDCTLVINDNSTDEYECLVKVNRPKAGNYTLLVSIENAYGSSKEFEIHIVSPGDDQEPGSTAWTMIIIGVVMAILFIVIILFTTFMAKKKGWLCYKRKTDQYPVSKRSANLTDDEYTTIPRADIDVDILL